MASLRELQHSFAAALRNTEGATEGATEGNCPVQPVANLAIYRHNAEYQFHQALAISFPVLRRRVGEDYFRQLAHHYRQGHPSRSGDLHWVGRDFPAFLESHLRETDYAWLADLGRLEWACELAAIAEWRAPIGAEVLGRFAAEDLGDLVFSLQPSLQLVQSAYPVFSVWQANQTENAPPVDQSMGHEQGMVLQRADRRDVRLLARPLLSYLRALTEGHALGDAMTQAQLDEAALLTALHFSFTQGLICDVSLKAKLSR